MSLNPQETYVSLDAAGAATPIPGGDRFWQMAPADLAQLGGEWLVSEYVFENDWPNWEMHPSADEFIYLLRGRITIYLEQIDGVHQISLESGGALIVPRGVWHTAKLSIPCQMLHVTRGVGTQTRPAFPA